MASITDGMSNTLLVGEYGTRTHPSRRTLWACTYTSYNQSSAMAQRRTLLNDYEKCQSIGGPGDPNVCKRAWGNFHARGGINFLLCDGSVRHINRDIGLDLFTGLATIAGGEVIGDF